jgi:protease secretion system outer membrane protein
MKSGVAIFLSLSCQISAWGGQFQQAFEAALGNDSAYSAARAELTSAQQNIPMARALLLPNVSLSVSDSQVNGTRASNDMFGQPVDTPLDYRAPAQSLNLRAPLFNLEGSRKLQIARAQVNFATAVFAARKLELLERLTTAYLQRLLSEQSLKLAQAQLDAAVLQNELARRKLQMGEGTTPELAEADALSEMAKVMLFDAQNQREVDDLNLRQITGANWSFQGHHAEGLVLPHVVAEPPATMDSLTELLSKANAGNPTIAARRHAVELAQTAVARNGAGHYPRLDLVASTSRASNESLSTLNQSVSQRSWGLQLNVPLYSGGYVNASVTQAQADRDKADADLAATQQTVTLEVTKAYFSVVNGPAKLAAYKKSVASSQLALVAVRKGLVTGFNTQAEVVQGYRRLVQTQREWVQAANEYLLARVRLGARIGVEPADVAAALDTILISP